MSVDKYQMVEAIGIGLAGGWTANTLVQSLFLHRYETHGAIRLKPAAEKAGRFLTWLMTGIKPRQWVGVHLRHHKNADQPERKVGDVVIPADPHSPKLYKPFGAMKVRFGNLFMYKPVAKEVDETGDYPSRLAPDKLDRRLYDRGWVGQIALYGLYSSMLGPKAGAAALIAHDAYVIWTGGETNATHSLDEPNENGTYVRNLDPVRTFLLAGEGEHANHHERPRSLQIARNILLDPAAMVGKFLIKVGLAEPGIKSAA